MNSPGKGHPSAQRASRAGLKSSCKLNRRFYSTCLNLARNYILPELQEIKQ